jgi:putative ABC transport system permease protein
LRSARFLPADDLDRARPVAVLGAKVHRELYREGANPLGERIRIVASATESSA